MSRGTRGFTLVEVLVSLSILALSLSVLLPSFSDGLKAQTRADAHALLALQAQSKLAEIGTTTAIEEGETAGLLKDGGQWRIEMRPYSEPEMSSWLPAPFFLYSVVVEVEDAHGTSFALTTLRLGRSP